MTQAQIIRDWADYWYNMLLYAQPDLVSPYTMAEIMQDLARRFEAEENNNET